MVRVEAKADADDLLVSAFAGKGDTGTVVVLNRSTKPRRLRLEWAGVKLTEMEIVDPYHENAVQKAPAQLANGTTEIVVDPGAIVTFTSAALGSYK
jgi:hypothetical protein